MQPVPGGVQPAVSYGNSRVSLVSGLTLMNPENTQRLAAFSFYSALSSLLLQDSAEGCQESVNMGPYQEQIKTEIKPEHYNNDGRQASVHIEPVELLDIHGKSPGKNIPCRCGKHSARYLVGKFQLTVGDVGIHHRKNKRHHTP